MDERRQKLSRRRMVAGTGTAAALAAAAVAVGPGHREAATQAPPDGQPKSAGNEGGYRETDHVLRYYRTARV